MNMNKYTDNKQETEEMEILDNVLGFQKQTEQEYLHDLNDKSDGLESDSE